MVTVIPRKDEPFEKVLRRFRREVEKAGILKAKKVRNYYEKPSVKGERKQREVAIFLDQVGVFGQTYADIRILIGFFTTQMEL